MRPRIGTSTPESALMATAHARSERAGNPFEAKSAAIIKQTVRKLSREGAPTSLLDMVKDARIGHAGRFASVAEATARRLFNGRLAAKAKARHADEEDEDESEDEDFEGDDDTDDDDDDEVDPDEDATEDEDGDDEPPKKAAKKKAATKAAKKVNPQRALAATARLEKEVSDMLKPKKKKKTKAPDAVTEDLTSILGGAYPDRSAKAFADAFGVTTVAGLDELRIKAAKGSFRAAQVARDGRVDAADFGFTEDQGKIQRTVHPELYGAAEASAPVANVWSVSSMMPRPSVNGREK